MCTKCWKHYNCTKIVYFHYFLCSIAISNLEINHLKIVFNPKTATIPSNINIVSQAVAELCLFQENLVAKIGLNTRSPFAITISNKHLFLSHTYFL